MEAPFSTATALSAGTLARVLNDNALLLAGREELAVRLFAAWAQARQVIACDHCAIFSWPERELLALCEADCPAAASDGLYRQLEQHTRILDDEMGSAAGAPRQRVEPADAIAAADPAASYLSLPLVGPDGMLGLIHLTRGGDQPFSLDEVVVLCVIASQFAACLAQHRYQERLARAAEARGRFLAQVAHELRNALHPAQLHIRLIQAAAGAEPRVQRPLERLDTSVGQMARLVDDMLDTQRIVNGLVVLHRERVDLNRVAAAVIENQRPAAEEKALGLQLEQNPDPVLVEGDPMRLDQVVTNLVNNAIRYSDSGAVRVEVSRKDADALVRVADTGIGMDSETQAHAFELFRTQAADVEHGRGGLGIGLAVVKQLVELHGGSVSCSSAGRGQGSEFAVRLPLAGETS